MATVERPTFGNHEVTNQPPPLVDYNVFEADRPLVEAVRARGRRVGRGADRRGRRATPAAERRRSWAAGEREPAEAADPRPLRQPRRRGRVPPRLARAARRSRSSTSCTRSPGGTRGPAPTSPAAPPSCACPQAEAGIGCPISMTYSVIPALRTQPELAAEWEPRFLSSSYDPRNAPAPRSRAPWPGWG